MRQQGYQREGPQLTALTLETMTDRRTDPRAILDALRCGRVSNPVLFMIRSDCFVFSLSHHV